MSAIIQRFEVVIEGPATAAVLVKGVAGATITFLHVGADPKSPDFTVAGEGEDGADATVTFDDEGVFVFTGRYIQA